MGYLQQTKLRKGSSRHEVKASSIETQLGSRITVSAGLSADTSAFNETHLSEFNGNAGPANGNKNCHNLYGGDTAQPSNITGDADLRMILGGYDNTLGASLACSIVCSHHSSIDDSSSHAFLFGGSTLVATGISYGSAIGGQFVTISGRCTSTMSCQGVDAGSPFTVNADFGVAISAAHGAVTAVRGVSQGLGAVAHSPGMVAKAEGFDTAMGDRQLGYIGPFRGQTTSGSYVDLRTNASALDHGNQGGQYTIPNDCCVHMHYRAFGVSDDGTEYCIMEKHAIYRNSGGTISEVYRAFDADAIVNERTDSNYTCGTDITGNVFDLRARSKTGVTMNWIVDLWVKEIGF